MESEPQLARLYNLYTMCRQQHVVSYQTAKGKDGTVQNLRFYTSGLALLPEDGGVLDQPYRMMCFFDIFLDGDKHGFSENVRKKQ